MINLDPLQSMKMGKLDSMLAALMGLIKAPMVLMWMIYSISSLAVEEVEGLVRTREVVDL